MLKKVVCLSAVLMLSSCNALSDNTLIIRDLSEETSNPTTVQSNVNVSSDTRATEARIITSDNYADCFADSSSEPAELDDEDAECKYFVYNDTVWTKTFDAFPADAISGRGECYLADGLREVLYSSSFSNEQSVGVLVYEWCSYYDNTLSRDDIVSFFSDFGFDTEYSTDETVKKRECEFMANMPEEYFTVIGSIGQIKSFIEHCLQTDEAYVLHLAPCLYGYYSEDTVDLNFDIVPNNGEIHIDDTLFDMLLGGDIEHDSLFAVSLKCWSITEEESEKSGIFYDCVEYMESFGFYVQYCKRCTYLGSNNQRKYINGSDFDMVILGTYDTICNFIREAVKTEYSFGLYPARYIY